MTQVVRRDAGRRAETIDVALPAAARLTAAGLSAVTTLVIARSLAKAEYGRFALLTGIVGLLVLIADFGLTSSLARYVAEGRVSRPLLIRAAGLRALLAALAGVGLLTWGMLAGDWGTVRHGHDPVLALTAWAAVLVLANSTVAMAHGLLPALRRARTLAFLIVFQPALELLGVVIALGAGLDASAALAALVVAAACGAVVAVTVLLTHRQPEDGDVGLTQLVRYALPLFAVWVSVGAFGIIDQILISAFHGVVAAAPYALSWKLVAMMHLPAVAAASAVAPRLVQERATAGELFDRWIKVAGVTYVGAVVIAASLSPELFGLLGTQYRTDWRVFVALAGYAVLMGVGPMVSLACNFLGAARLRLRIALIAVGLNTAVDLVLIPAHGVYGAAAGTTVAYLLYVGAHWRLARRLLGPVPGRRLAVTARGTLAAAVLAMVAARLSLVVLAPVGSAAPVLAAAVALAAYVALALPVADLLGLSPKASPAR